MNNNYQNEYNYKNETNIEKAQCETPYGKKIESFEIEFFIC